MKPKWSHLPNAKYIDRILAHVKTDSVAADARTAVAAVPRSEAEDAARSVAGDAARYAARLVAGDAARSEAWSAARSAAWSAAWSAARYAWDASWDASRDAARDAAWDAARDAWDAAWDAILALVAWDHAGALLDLPAEQVRVLALLGQPPAILIYPTVLAMENSPKSLIINRIDLVDQ